MFMGLLITWFTFNYKQPINEVVLELARTITAAYKKNVLLSDVLECCCKRGQVTQRKWIYQLHCASHCWVKGRRASTFRLAQMWASLFTPRQESCLPGNVPPFVDNLDVPILLMLSTGQRPRWRPKPMIEDAFKSVHCVSPPMHPHLVWCHIYLEQTPNNWIFKNEIKKSYKI